MKSIQLTGGDPPITNEIEAAMCPVFARRKPHVPALFCRFWPKSGPERV